MTIRSDLSIRDPEKRPHFQRYALSVIETANAAGVGRDKIYEAIKAGELPAHKLGSRTLILAEDIKIWLAGLPTFCESVRDHG